MVRVAIHQPEFLGWLGLYHKISRADVYVVFDNVQFIKRGFLQRNRIKTPHGVQWLTVPVLTKGRFTQSIREVRIDEGRDWRSKHLATLRHAYASSPRLDEVVGKVEVAYALGHELLHELSLSLLESFSALLGLSPRFVLASELGVKSSGTRQLVEITRAVGGDAYVTGMGGYRYMDLELLQKEGVLLETSDYRAIPYPQYHGPFAPNLSVLDPLLTVGPEATRELVLARGGRPPEDPVLGSISEPAEAEALEAQMLSTPEALAARPRNPHEDLP